MARSDLRPIVSRIDGLAAEINAFVPVSTPGTGQFRADLAGMLTVIVAASYESCVKETLVNFAARHGKQFSEYTVRRYERLNSRININDLYTYTRSFDPVIEASFKISLKGKRDSIEQRVGKSIIKSYEQILSWRHEYAHTGVRNTTIDEAMREHRLAIRVIYAFNEAFDKV